MNERNSGKIIGISIFVVSLTIVSLFPFRAFFAAGDTQSITDLEKQQQEEQAAREKQLAELNAKIKAYKDIITLKQKQGTTLKSQIDILEAQASQLEAEIQRNERKISDLGDQIKSVEASIAEKERLISQDRQILSELIREYYDSVSGGVQIVLASDTGGIFAKHGDWLEDTGDRIRKMLQDLDALKQDLDVNRVTLNASLVQSAELKNDLADRQDSLELTRNQKQNLLLRTQGEEQKYQNLLVRVEAQKKELLDFSAASNLDEVKASVKSYPTPDKKDWASTSWYFAQTDSRWGNQRIGNSNSLMKDYGCAIAAVSMVFRKYGSSTDPGKMARKKIFSYDLINWPVSWDPGISLVSSVSHGNVSWSTIDKQIKNGTPVIVHINKTNGKGGHYVVITGKDSKDYIVHDPYFGSNLYLGTSRALVGKLGIDSKTAIDQMIIYNG